MTTSGFDVFLSYNRHDSAPARELRRTLQGHGIVVWMDEEDLPPGRPWKESLGDAIGEVGSVIFAFGPSGFGPWHRAEVAEFLDEFHERELQILPVLLPGLVAEPELPPFLRQFTWVDMRDGFSPEAIARLIWGITRSKAFRGSSERLLEFGRRLLRDGASEWALTYLTAAIDVAPSSVDAIMDRGVAHLAAGAVPEAIADFTRALELQPDSAIAHYNRGMGYYHQGRIDQARADWRRAEGLGCPQASKALDSTDGLGGSKTSPAARPTD